MSDRVDVRRILEALACSDPRCECQRALRRGQGKTHCPCHDDRKPSLSISVARDGTTLLKCHAGCSNRDVVRALQDRDLWPRRERSERPAVRETRYEVRDVDGTLVAVHVRRDRPDGSKELFWQLPDGRWGLNGKRVEEVPLYGVEKLGDASEVVLCEGEKAADALARLGLPAVGTVCGASVTPSDDVLRPLVGRTVYVWPDNDDAGQAHMARIAARLAALGCDDIRVVEWPDAPPHGDAADFTKRGGTDDDVRQLLAAARPWQPVPEARGSDASGTPGDGLEHGEDCTDWQNARILAELLRDNALYVETWGWCVWDGFRWVRDPDGARVAALAAERLSRYYLQRALAATNPTIRQRYAEYAIYVQSRARVNAALDLARGLLLARPDEFDRNAWELNVSNGILDLRSGTLRTRTPHDRVTKLAPVTYHAGVDWRELAPTWAVFIERVLPDPDVRHFVQELSGIALTGDTSEHIFPVHWGGGANGKSTLIRALLAVLGDYAIMAAPELVAQKRDRHPTEIADLFGVRLAVSIELDEGKRLAEALLKQLTGGDRIRARYMRQDFFEFAPSHKLWLVTNHRPVIRGTDHAIWRRLLLIPYTVTIPEDERDPRLPDRLVAERDGILLWMLEGLQRYLQHGLQVPDTVRVATAQYRREQDALADWIESCCVLDPQAVTPFRELYASYTAWCEEQAEPPMSSRRFADRLTERGFLATPLPGNARVKARAGIRLRRDHEPETPEPDHHEDSSSEDASTTDSRDTRSPISPIAPKTGMNPKTYMQSRLTRRIGEIGEIGERSRSGRARQCGNGPPVKLVAWSERLHAALEAGLVLPPVELTLGEHVVDHWRFVRATLVDARAGDQTALERLARYRALVEPLLADQREAADF